MVSGTLVDANGAAVVTNLENYVAVDIFDVLMTAEFGEIAILGIAVGVEITAGEEFGWATEIAIVVRLCHCISEAGIDF